MTSWAAFWLFASVFVVCEAWLYSKGNDTLLWEHKTPAELEIQRANINPPPTYAKPLAPSAPPAPRRPTGQGTGDL
jgi:hypothetical protein